jgi:hypothetical protein
VSDAPAKKQINEAYNRLNAYLQDKFIPNKPTEVLEEVLSVAAEVRHMLLLKNKSYGNSALEPIKIFSKSDADDQIKVRIDDKLNRIRNQESYPGDNDIFDLIGYLLLLVVSKSYE